MSDQSGRRVVGKREAPSCLVVFLCEECGYVSVLDTYDGPPTCFGQARSHQARFMTPRVLAEGHPATGTREDLLTIEQWRSVFDVR